VVHAPAEDLSPRIGSLLGLIHVCNLAATVFDRDEASAASERADWIFKRDGIVRAVQEAVARSEGTWG